MPSRGGFDWGARGNILLRKASECAVAATGDQSGGHKQMTAGTNQTTLWRWQRAHLSGQQSGACSLPTTRWPSPASRSSFSLMAKAGGVRLAQYVAGGATHRKIDAAIVDDYSEAVSGVVVDRTHRPVHTRHKQPAFTTQQTAREPETETKGQSYAPLIL